MIRVVAGLAVMAALFSGRASAAGPEMSELVAAVRVALQDSRGEAQLQRTGEALGAFLREGSLDASVRQPHPGLDVTTYLLHVEPEGAFSIAALVIRPGARTPIHDHGTWTVWGTLEGRDRETRYVRDGAVSEIRLREVADREMAPGFVSRIPPPPDDLHRLANDGQVPSVSIHIHGADMSRQVRNAYDPDRQSVVSFVQSYVDVQGERER